ncbi:hypothetical protein D4764_0290650 [Takifugu flavidus]|uniref:Uncharacterized protein n=1 Tax=Takifugu flavidus TaxID=433684 RepID=A0A5C6MGP1_9TELE|nr:hypothetical protein D4764_0290650 [Takifugu flavidus]
MAGLAEGPWSQETPEQFYPVYRALLRQATGLQNHQFVDEMTYEVAARTGARKRKTFNIPNAQMRFGLQGSIPDRKLAQIREGSPNNRYTNPDCSLRSVNP